MSSSRSVVGAVLLLVLAPFVITFLLRLGIDPLVVIALCAGVGGALALTDRKRLAAGWLLGSAVWIGVLVWAVSRF